MTELLDAHYSNFVWLNLSHYYLLQAYHYMQELRARMPSVALSYFVNVSTIEAVHNAVGAPMGRSTMANGDGGKLRDDSDDEVSEEIFNVGF